MGWAGYALWLSLGLPLNAWAVGGDSLITSTSTITTTSSDSRSDQPPSVCQEPNCPDKNPKPTVSLTAPASGVSAVAPASFTLTATATDADGIAQVDFYSNDTLIGSDTTSPYSLVYTNVPSGSYTLKAVATDGEGATNTSATATVTVTAAPANTPPTVSLTDPANGATATAPASFTLTATATDADGIAQVDFYTNTTLIGSDTTSPYSVVYTNVPAGSYTLKAIATDNQGAATTSATATVTVTAPPANTPPTVSLTDPANGATAIAPANFTLTANAADSDGSIAQVDFYSNNTLIGSDTTSPYSLVYANVPAGSYTLKAIATDNQGAATTSATATVTVTAPPANTPPTVSLTAPANGSSATAPASFTLTANAADSNGSVAQVAFYANGSLLGTDTSAPYAWAYANTPVGSYSLTAIATDNQGAVTASAPISVSVTAAPVVTVTATRAYVYDTNERLCKTIDPESGATLVDYDAAGNVAWSVEGSALTSATCDRSSVSEASKTIRSYDVMNRVTAVTTPSGLANLTTTYEPDGLVKTLTAASPSGVNVVSTYTYNKRRLLTTETSSQPGWYVWTLSYGLNANGHLTTLTYPVGLVVDFAPNALGQASQAGTYATGVSYYPNGAIKQFTYGNGIIHTMTQNTRQLPARSEDKNGSVAILDDSYTFDANGNVTDITDAAQNGLTTRGMAYDARDRLTTAVAPGLWGNATYTYDALDNLGTATLGSAGYSYGYDSQNRLATLARSGGSTYSYATDARGNITSDGRQAYEFDERNRLTAVTGKESYLYDGMGRRTYQVRSDSSLSVSQYSQAGQILYRGDIITPENQRTHEYIYLAGSLVTTIDHSWPSNAITATNYQHTDALGSPVAVTDASKAVTERTQYTPYGAPFNHPVEGIGYTGHVMDQATGLAYAQQRYFDPQLGRFLSVDPMASDTNTGWNFNRYAYALNSPYTFSDPDGRMSERAAERWGDTVAKNPEVVKPFVPIAIAATAVMAAPVVAAVGWAALANPATATAVGVGAIEVGAAVATGAQVPSSAVVTEAKIASALIGSTMKTTQKAVSLPAVQRYVTQLKNGSPAPAIKVAGNVIVDGNHRYVAGRVAGQEPAIQAGVLAPGQASQVKPIQDLKVDLQDWGNQ